MSVIQQIQEKYAKLMAVIIAVALIIFVVMLAFENGGSLFSGQTNTLATINGKKIDINEFEKTVQYQEKNMEAQMGAGKSYRNEAISNVWQQEKGKILLTEEYNKLGVSVGKKEWGDLLYGENPPQDLLQMYSDKTTGKYNPQLAKQNISQMLKSGTVDQKEQFNAYFDNLENVRLNEKFTALLSNSINFPKWLVESQNADNSQMAKITYAKQSYTTIPDSTIKISDEEIASYIAKHKDQYKQEENRAIEYVAFSALPLQKDSIAAMIKIGQLKAGFDTTDNVEDYLQVNGVQTFYNGYNSYKSLEKLNKEAILAAPVGTVYGPYYDKNNYEMVKMMGKRTQPDSVTIRHILIATQQRDPQSGQMMTVKDSATAKKTADSVQTVIASGSSFDSLCQQLSEDEGSKGKGGIYEKVTAGNMVPEFNDFIFGNAIGTKKVVKTVFGYHYIEILSQKGSSTAYKMAFLPVTIEASEETDKAAENAATLFAGDSKLATDFEKSALKLQSEKKNIQKLSANNILPDATNIQGLGESRSFVKEIYAAKKGDIINPQRVGDNYVVALVTEVNEKGTQSVSQAKQIVESILKNKKKAEIIIKKVGTVTSLETAVGKLQGATIQTVDSIRLFGNNTMDFFNEKRVIGAAFNPANKGKVVPNAIEGSTGVFILKVDNISATANLMANVEEQRKQQYQQAKSQSGYYYMDALNETADIKDNRRKFY